ncbi:ATP-binding cassette domain-containing protein [Micromonospora zhanjiangensis]|uniref:ATP-binding cassette domain-containing protein n=1 Tax=Micromonospora zhanjiangensis TaxID=1522057 RepID=A0ABV8KQV5_9ACTN
MSRARAEADPAGTDEGLRGVGRYTLGAVRRRARAVRRLAGWSVPEAVPTLLVGALTARAVDDGFLAGRPTVGLAWLAVLAGAVLVGAVGTGRTYACLGDLVEPFRDDLVERVVGGALRRSTAPGGRPDTAAVARLTHQVEIVRDTFGGLVMVVRGFVFTTGAALVGLFSLAPAVAALVAGPLLVGLVLFGCAIPTMAAAQRAYVRADECLGAAAGGALAGHRDVVACGAQDEVTAAVGALVGAQATAERRLARMAALRSLTLAVGGWLPLAVLVLGAPALVRHGLTPGAILGALVYVSTALHPALHSLVQGVATGGLRFAVTLDRILTASASPPAPAPPPEPPRAGPRGAGAGAVRLSGLTFRYGPHARPVFRDLDLDLAAGEHLAVVGPSGAGKSTLAGLIAGLLAPQTGTVRLDGADVAGRDQAELAARRVLIPQEAYVFTGSLGDNLRYLRPTADPDEVATVVDRLGLHRLVDRVGGLAGTVDPGTLSAGERQLVALARAYLSPAPLVILDEATCHLDAPAEARAERAFADRPGTLVVVAHRISSALRAGRVLLVDGGPPVLGRHDDVFARSATYRDLVGHWQRGADPVAPDTGARPGSDPALVAGDPDGLDPGPGAGLAGDPGQVVAHRARPERQPVGDLDNG